jgi:Berberine and berberine like
LGALLIYNIQTFLPTYLDNSQDGAYPHVRSSIPIFPFDMLFGWASPLDDQIFLEQIQSTTTALYQIVLSEGQDIRGSKQILYPNYALSDTPLEQMYGENVQRLRNIRKSWDPNDVMYLTGGFKF